MYLTKILKRGKSEQERSVFVDEHELKQKIKKS